MERFSVLIPLAMLADPIDLTRGSEVMFVAVTEFT
jgi:hypothetical protein